jgi:hypothetical protein
MISEHGPAQQNHNGYTQCEKDDEDTLHQVVNESKSAIAELRRQETRNLLSKKHRAIGGWLERCVYSATSQRSQTCLSKAPSGLK